MDLLLIILLIVTLIVWLIGISFLVEIAKEKTSNAPVALLWLMGIFGTPIFTALLVIALPDERRRDEVDKRLVAIEKALKAQPLQPAVCSNTATAPKPNSITARHEAEASQQTNVSENSNADTRYSYIQLVRFCDACQQPYFDGTQVCPFCHTPTLELQCSDYAWKSGAFSSDDARATLVKKAGGTYRK